VDTVLSCDRFLQALVGEGTHFAGVLIDNVVVMALGIGSLIPCDAVPSVQPVRQAKLEHRVEVARRSETSLEIR